MKAVTLESISESGKELLFCILIIQPYMYVKGRRKRMGRWGLVPQQVLKEFLFFIFWFDLIDFLNLI